MKAKFPPFETETANKTTNAPFDKNISAVYPTEAHPASQMRVKTEEHRLLGPSEMEYLINKEHS